MLDYATQPRLDKRLVTFVDPGSFGAEQYRRLRSQIEMIAAARPLHIIAVTSAEVAAGKTVTAINLAGALAGEHGDRVLLVDGDLRRPSLARKLDLDTGRAGLTAALNGTPGPLDTFVQRISGTNLSVLPCEAATPEAYEVLSSPRLAALLTEARRQYRYVIVDTPPIIPVPDSALLRRLVDGYLVVVSAGRTPRKLVGEALNLLEPALVIGLILNKDDRPLFGYYRSHYRQYFETAQPLKVGHVKE
jgi:capsular exopolysaccharide synthesis family protein